MKYLTTRKAIVENTPARYLVCAGYCELQYLLRDVSPVAYTRGVYGWNFDVYEVHGLTICTGYRNMPGRHAKGCTEYNKAAEAACSWTSDDKAKRAALLKEFCELNLKEGC